LFDVKYWRKAASESQLHGEKPQEQLNSRIQTISRYFWVKSLRMQF